MASFPPNSSSSGEFPFPLFNFNWLSQRSPSSSDIFHHGLFFKLWDLCWAQLCLLIPCILLPSLYSWPSRDTQLWNCPWVWAAQMFLQQDNIQIQTLALLHMKTTSLTNFPHLGRVEILPTSQTGILGVTLILHILCSPCLPSSFIWFASLHHSQS